MNFSASLLSLLLCPALSASLSAYGQVPSAQAFAQPQIEFTQGQVEVLRAGSQSWDLASAQTGYNILYPGDELRTGGNGRAGLRLPNEKATVILDTDGLLFMPPKQLDGPGLVLKLGRLLNLHRGPFGGQKFQTPLVSAIIRGTDFALAVSQDGTTTLSVLDGQVTMQNAFGGLEVKSGEQAIVQPGQAPHPLPAIITLDVIQWCLYYPAVLDARELPLTEIERIDLKSSLAHYAQGNLYAALTALPVDWRQHSPAEQLYGAALLLGTGDVDNAGPLLTKLGPLDLGSNHEVRRLAEALQKMVATVKLQPSAEMNLAGAGTRLATECLVESYHQQSLGWLGKALEAAKRATQIDPAFGGAWERVAELEFGFSHLSAARAALDQSLTLAPENAQAAALKGFVFSGENHIGEAITQFNRAINLDPGLANGWLGRGLCQFRLGASKAGLDDLQMAATVEPQRSLLRSYLGKAFANEGNEKRANHELELALKADPRDPTGWLYSALLKQQENRVNESITDLEESQSLNDNRKLFRSNQLLDQDRAVGSVNLATMYNDAGMPDVGVREAAKAVTDDYANSSAHLFLSDSYNDLRDPTQFNLRYETVWFNELLLANLLAPVGGGRLAQNVSQQEYSKLFESDGFGLANSTLWSSAKSLTQLTSQYGTFGNTSYALDLDYQHNDGVRVNNGLDSINWDTTIKQQITAQDTALVLLQYQDYHSGDNFQYYNQSSADPNYQFDETQHPILLAGWHHEWAPGIHTLLLGGRLEDEQHFTDLSVPELGLLQNSLGMTTQVGSVPLDVDVRNKLEIYTAELNQIFEWNRVTISAGGRYQNGTFDASSLLNNPPPDLRFVFGSPASEVATTDGFERLTGYGYLTVEPADRLWLTGGLAYDDLTYPMNFRNPPIAPGDDHVSQLGPKAAVVWNPLSEITLRGDYTKSLGGVSIDESYRLEPTELAGFPQAFRSLIPESVAGSVAAPEYQTYGLALDFKFPTGTYAGIQVGRLETKISQDVGVMSLSTGQLLFQSASTPNTFDYGENDFCISVDQLVGKDVAVGANYTISQAKLDDDLPAIPVTVYSAARQNLESDLQQVGTYVAFNHSSGFFARVELHWYSQSNSGYSPAEPGDNFFQENIFAGWRFDQRRIQVTAGVLNLADSDYHLSPLNIHPEWPHQRTFTLQLNFIF